MTVETYFLLQLKPVSRSKLVCGFSFFWTLGPNGLIDGPFVYKAIGTDGLNEQRKFLLTAGLSLLLLDLVAVHTVQEILNVNKNKINFYIVDLSSYFYSVNRYM